MSNPTTTQKAAIVVLSDPQPGTEEALGRVFNALAAAYDFQHRGDEVTVLFQGAGTRWPSVLSEAGHPAHALYQAVAGRIAGVSCACAEVFGATAAAESAGMALVKDSPVPGTSGLPSLAKLVADGYRVLTF